MVLAQLHQPRACTTRACAPPRLRPGSRSPAPWFPPGAFADRTTRHGAHPLYVCNSGVSGVPRASGSRTRPSESVPVTPKKLHVHQPPLPAPGSPTAGRANVGAVHSHPGPLVSRVLSFADVSRAVPRQRVSASFRSAAESAPAVWGARVALPCRPWPSLGCCGLCRCERPTPAAGPLLQAQARRELPGHGPPATVPAPRCLRLAVLLPWLPLHVPSHPHKALLCLPVPRRSGACGGCSVLPSVLSGPMCPSSYCVQSRVTPEDPIF